MLVSNCAFEKDMGQKWDVASAYLTPVHSCSLAARLMFLGLASPCWAKCTVLCNCIVQRLAQKDLIIEGSAAKRGNNDVVFLFTPYFSP